jgi:hypothetical protein
MRGQLAPAALMSCALPAENTMSAMTGSPHSLLDMPATLPVTARVVTGRVAGMSNKSNIS